MTPEEYYYKYIVKDKTELYEMRIKSLQWMLSCFKKELLDKELLWTYPFGTITQFTQFISLKRKDTKIVSSQRSNRYYIRTQKIRL